MNLTVSASAMLLLLCCLSVSHNLQSSETVHDIRVDGLVIAETLRHVAETYKTVIGFEDSEPPPYNKQIKIALKHVTLAQVMNAVTAADPRYSWRRGPKNVVRIFSRSATFTLPDTVLGSLQFEDLGRRQIEDLLNAVPEVVAWRKQKGCSLGGADVITGMRPLDQTKVTFASSDQSLDRDLDEIVRKLGSYYWIVAQSNSDHGCSVSIALPSPDLPRRITR